MYSFDGNLYYVCSQTALSCVELHTSKFSSSRSLQHLPDHLQKSLGTLNQLTASLLLVYRIAVATGNPVL